MVSDSMGDECHIIGKQTHVRTHTYTEESNLTIRSDVFFLEQSDMVLPELCWVQLGAVHPSVCRSGFRDP